LLVPKETIVPGDNVTSPDPGYGVNETVNEVCSSGSLRCSGSELQECTDNVWHIRETCKEGCDDQKLLCRQGSQTDLPETQSGSSIMIWVLVGLVILALAGTIYAVKKRPQRDSFWVKPA
jgi:hypothetical protein